LASAAEVFYHALSVWKMKFFLDPILASSSEETSVFSVRSLVMFLHGSFSDSTDQLRVLDCLK
jgi:hypothetical protein